MTRGFVPGESGNARSASSRDARLRTAPARRRLVASLVGLALALAAPAWAREEGPRPLVTLTTVVAEPASLFNLVDRLSDWRDREDDAPDARYRGVWEKFVGPLGPADLAALETWRTIRRRYRGTPLEGGAGLVDAMAAAGLPFPVSVERLRLEDKLALVFLDADDWSELDRRAELVLSAPDRDALLGAVAHFRERLGPLLRRSLHLEAYRARLLSWARRERPAPFLERLARFLHTPEDRPLDFVAHLVWLPEGATDRRATVVERHAALEVRDGLGLGGVLAVAVHELTHRLEERMPRDVRVRLEQAFLTAPEAAADGSYAVAAANLFTEGLATAVGQGLFVQELFPEDSDPRIAWYDDPGYDGFARIVAVSAKGYLAEGRPMDEAFIHEVVRTYAMTFLSNTPTADVLRRAVVLSDDADARGAARRAIARAARTRALLDYSLADALALAPADTNARRALATFPALPVVVLVADADVPRLSDLPVTPPIDPSALGADAVVTLRRPRAGPIFVARGVDTAAAAAAFARFLSAESPPPKTE